MAAKQKTQASLVMKVKKEMKSKTIKGGGKSLRAALIKNMRSKAPGAKSRLGGTTDCSKGMASAAHDIPIHSRGGLPGKGGFPVEKWASKFPDMVVDLGRSAWLPDAWGQGIKTTTPTARSTGTGGGMLTSFISPDGRRFFHKHMVEKTVGHPLDFTDGFSGQLRWARLHAEFLHCNDSAFFKLLTPAERAVLPKKEDLSFCIISARRTQTAEGVRDIATVQAKFLVDGVEPTWYVDEASLAEYKKLGLKAVVGGKLCPARNMALKDAARQGKACVEVSDDISQWEYRHGERAKERTDAAVNAAFAASTRYVLSPVTAARFMLAKMRALNKISGTKEKPQLAGVYPLGSCSRAFAGDETGPRSFILGDFFVADKSPVRFDEDMTLKEDYDFTCSHIAKHGAVLRFNRLTIAAKHQTNPGGAVASRDKKGKEEDKNISILRRKWPGVFSDNPKRKHEVILRWKQQLGDHEDEDDGDIISAARSTNHTKVAKKQSGKEVDRRKVVKKNAKK